MKGIVTEEEFNDYENRKLKELVLRFRAALRFVSMAEIAKGTGLRWDTVNRFRRGESISFRTQCRIERFLQSKGVTL
jgi:hypothetical protein